MTSPWTNPLPTGPRVGPVFPAAAPLAPVDTAEPELPPFTLADDPDFPTAVDPALDGYTPPTLADLGLTDDLVALVLSLREQADTARTRIAELIAGMTPQQRADLAQYERPARHLRAVA